MNSRLIFRISAIVEISTGVALLIAPLLTIDLLFGGELGPVGIAVARVLGVGLLSVGVAVWESPHQAAGFAPRLGICIYNLGATTLRALFSTVAGMNGILLWPALMLHGVIGAAML